MKLHQIIIVIILLGIMSLVTAHYIRTQGEAPARPTQAQVTTSYMRVMRSGILRCGFEYWDGAIMRDPVSGALYGPWVDIMEAVGSATGLKIEWATQVGWGEVGAALKSGKIDAMCAGMWTSAAKAKEISFSTPLAYQALEAFVRADDHRFDGNLDKLNDPGVTIAVIENDNSDFIAQQDFPNAKKDSLGQLNGTDSELLMQVMTGKGDVTFTVPGLWREFDKANPGKLRRLAPGNRLRAFGLAIAVDNDDVRLLEAINAGVDEVRNSNFLGKILDRANQTWPDMYIKPAAPF